MLVLSGDFHAGRRRIESKKKTRPYDRGLPRPLRLRFLIISGRDARVTTIARTARKRRSKTSVMAVPTTSAPKILLQPCRSMAMHMKAHWMTNIHHQFFRMATSRRFSFFISLLSLVRSFCSACGSAVRAVEPVQHDRDEPEYLVVHRFLEDAEKNIPKVVSNLTGTEAFLNLCALAVTDKVTGSDKLERKIASVIEGPILKPCRNAAAVYGCNINPALARGYLSNLHRDSMTSALYASGGLALEAAFLKTTLKSVQCVIGPIAGKIATKFGTGAALAAADGPLPFGDAFGVVLAVGGTAWSVHDLLALRRDLPGAISAALRQAILDYWKQCRLEAAK